MWTVRTILNYLETVDQTLDVLVNGEVPSILVQDNKVYIYHNPFDHTGHDKVYKIVDALSELYNGMMVAGWSGVIRPHMMMIISNHKLKVRYL